jgi:hypothetical protein
MDNTQDRIDRADFLKRASALFAVAVIDYATIRRGGRMIMTNVEHPDPRPGITAERVLTAADLGDFAKKKNVVNAYDGAREHPEIFDGISCACGCAEQSAPHRSLLVCYETKQPTGCGGCREEAIFISGLAKEKKTLAEIRTAVDKKFG